LCRDDAARTMSSSRRASGDAAIPFDTEHKAFTRDA
jgi:hypothetical protein